jgi:hypothetical protein
MYLLKANLIGDKPLDVARDAWRIIAREGMKAVAEHWHQHILPKHFTPEARYRYAHQLRGRGYNARKVKKAAAGQPFQSGGQPVIGPQPVDNVLTGYLRNQLTSTKAITAYPTRVTLKMFGPRYITMRSFRGDLRRAMREGWTYGKGQTFHAGMGRQQPDKIAEITKITSAEMAELIGVLEAKVAEQLAKYRLSRGT